MCETIKNTPIRITPSESELCTVNKSLPCPECSSTFTSSSNLDLHLVKRHKIGALPKAIPSVQYHCPAVGCIYSNQRHFAKRKYVKQHYLKVHAAKNFVCESCKSGYSTAAALKQHTAICGRKFPCPCGLFFNSPEALANHMRRLGHRKFVSHENKAAKGVRSMPPAPVILAAVALSELSFRSRRDIAAQTESLRQHGVATQTSRRISATTQTLPRRPIAPKHDEQVTSQVTQTSQSPPTSRKRKSAQTQTNPSKARRQTTPLIPEKINHDSVTPHPLEPTTNDGPVTPLPLEPSANEVDALFSEGAELLDALWAGQLDCQTQTEPEPSFLDQLLDCASQTEEESDSLDSTTQTCDHFLFPELGCCHDMHTQTDLR